MLTHETKKEGAEVFFRRLSPAAGGLRGQRDVFIV